MSRAKAKTTVLKAEGLTPAGLLASGLTLAALLTLLLLLTGP